MMPICATTAIVFAGAALAETVGCFAFWARLRQRLSRCGQ
jgi:small multidrug resistance family-3 protein